MTKGRLQAFFRGQITNESIMVRGAYLHEPGRNKSEDDPLEPNEQLLSPPLL